MVMATKKTVKTVTPAKAKKAVPAAKAAVVKKASPAKKAVDVEAIRKKAEEIYHARVARGEHGTADTDWHQAEKLVKSGGKPAAKKVVAKKPAAKKPVAKKK
jgi:hypothetical protein